MGYYIIYTMGTRQPIFPSTHSQFQERLLQNMRIIKGFVSMAHPFGRLFSPMSQLRLRRGNGIANPFAADKGG